MAVEYVLAGSIFGNIMTIGRFIHPGNWMCVEGPGTVRSFLVVAVTNLSSRMILISKTNAKALN